MKQSITLLAGLALMFLSGCRTAPKFDSQYAYDRDLRDSSLMMETLQDWDAGNREKAQAIAIARVNAGLYLMPDFAAKSHPEPWQKEEQAALAKKVLEYMYAHRAEIGRSWELHADSLRTMLTDPEDLRRLAELEDCLTKAGNKL
jgi:hypothetical protein